MSEVPKVIERLKRHFPDGAPFHPKYYDYIQNPKPDGYRGIHIALKYRSKSPSHTDWNGKRIEIQVRSTLQHAWATAVETVDLFESEKLKKAAPLQTARADFCAC